MSIAPSSSRASLGASLGVSSGAAQQAQHALQSLRDVFGDVLPQNSDGALAMLSSSPAAPTDVATLQAMRALIVENAGKKIGTLAEQASKLTTLMGDPPSATQSKAMPAAVALRLAVLTERSQSIVGKKGPDGLIHVISPQKADAIFAAMKNSDIPHDFIDEGCLNRAHVMSHRLEKEGIFTDKAFIIPEGNDLYMESPRHPLGFTVCWFHTAPCVHVEVEPGKIERRMIDPSLFDKPVSPEEWSSKMRGVGGEACELFYLPRFAYHLGDRVDVPTVWRKDDLDTAYAWNTEYAEVKKSLVETNFYDYLKTLVSGEGK